MKANPQGRSGAFQSPWGSECAVPAGRPSWSQSVHRDGILMMNAIFFSKGGPQ